MKNGKGYKRIGAIEKTARIMREVAQAGTDGATATEIADAVDTSLATAYSYLETLADVGYIRQGGRGYILGMGLAVFWAKMRAMKEAEIRSAGQDLNELGVTTEVTIG